MDKIARLSPEERRGLFSEAASKLGIRPTIIEKDFWVCLVLKTLFVDSPFANALVFKGGTSLSKVYRAIERFSEDVDLVLDWKLIGYGEDLIDPMQPFDSNTKRDKFNKEINRLAAAYIRETLCPELRNVVQTTSLALTVTVDDTDPHVVNIRYPAAFTESYIRPEVRLEIGPLASWVPSARHVIRPYAFDVFPEVFDDPECPVIAIAAERTFWEKATILHQEAHRKTPVPPRYSRHYYDLHLLALSAIKEQAFAQIELLSDVVQFKKRFYPSPWARYDLAVPGSFRLLPATTSQTNDLEKDYEDMRVMLFGNSPDFASILNGLQQLELQINAITAT